MSAGLFGSGFGGLERAALLLQDLTENDGQAGDGCEHGAEDLGVQGQIQEYAVFDEKNQTYVWVRLDRKSVV